MYNKNTNQKYELSFIFFKYLLRDRKIILFTTFFGIFIAMIYVSFLPQRVSVSADMLISNISDINDENKQEKSLIKSGLFTFYKVKKSIASYELKINDCDFDSENNFIFSVEKNLKISVKDNINNIYNVSIQNIKTDNPEKCIEQLANMILYIHTKSASETNEKLEKYLNENINLYNSIISDILKKNEIDNKISHLEAKSITFENSIFIIKSIIINRNTEVKIFKPLNYEHTKTPIFILKKILFGLFFGFFLGIIFIIFASIYKIINSELYKYDFN